MTDMNKSETISTSTPETSTAIKNGQKTPPQLLLNPPTNPAFAKLAASKALSPNGNDERIRDLWTNGSSDQKEPQNIPEPNGNGNGTQHDSAATAMHPDEAWKVVGSPPRRASLTPPSPNRPPSINTDELHEKDSLGELGSMSGASRRTPRTRAASTPNPLLHEPFQINTTNLAPPTTVPTSQALQGLQGSAGIWGQPTIWKDRLRSPSGSQPVLSQEALLAMAASQARSRSKSSSAISTLLTPEDALSFAALAQEAMKDPNNPVDLNALWAAHVANNAAAAAAAARANVNGGGMDDSLHRRSVTSPNFTPAGWNPIPMPSIATTTVSMMPSTVAGGSMEPPSPATPLLDPERFSNQRRYSHAPQLFHDWSEIGPEDHYPYPVPRRHSVAGPVLYSPSEVMATTPTFIDQFDQMSLHSPAVMEKIDDYFENTEQRTRAWMEAGRNLQNGNGAITQWPLYVVEFKAGRTDYFYVPEGTNITVKLGDLIIVEADRGKDLGKVIYDGIRNMQQLQMYQAAHPEVIMDVHPQREVIPKKIFRLAQPQEIALLVQKSRDEMDTKEVCQRKIKQKKLPMQIVDAEFQWDRRKLTFYFVSDRRIDFRELVRELFKLYKTRIWMCQLRPQGVPRSPVTAGF